MRSALFALVAMFLTLSAAHGKTLRLYPGVAPGSEHWTRPEVAQATPTGETIYSNVRDPELIPYLPDHAKSNGAAVIILPGGGLRILSIGHEANDLIHLLNDRGVAVFVLKYRTLQAAPSPIRTTVGQPIKFPKLVIRKANANPASNDEALGTVLRLAVSDTQTALRIVRDNAMKWHIDPARVGLIGSSAGGGVAIGTVLAQKPTAVPDFIISLYGPSLQDVEVPPSAPPLFIATETAHGPVTDGLLALFGLWKDAGKSAEIHVFDVPNFSMPVRLFSELMMAWMQRNKIIPEVR